MARPARPRAKPEDANPEGPTSPKGAPELATILIRGLAARTIIGIHPDERAKRQDVLVDLALTVRTTAGRTDDIADAVDYKAVKDAVLDHIERSRHHLLESLAQGIADRCLRQPGVEEVEVVVDKPGALRFARSVAVRLLRTRTAQPAAPSAAAQPVPAVRRSWGDRG